MSDISLLIIFSIILYIAHSIVMGLMREDILIETFSDTLSNDRVDIGKAVLQIERETIYENATRESDEFEEALIRHNRMMVDDDYLEDRIDEYISDMKLLIAVRRLHLILYTAWSNIPTILPLVLLIIIGSVPISLAVSATVMIFQAISSEKELMEWASEILSEKDIDDIISPLSVKLTIALNVLFRNSHFYIILFLLFFIGWI